MLTREGHALNAERSSVRSGWPARASTPPADARRASHAAPILLLDRAWLRRWRGMLAIRTAGARVVGADSEAQALGRLPGSGAHMVLVHVDEPRPDLTELLRRLYTLAPGVYCVAVGTATRDADLERCFALGFDDYLTWPLQPQALYAAAESAAEAREATIASPEYLAQLGDEAHTGPLQEQLLVHLRDEADRLLAFLNAADSSRDRLARWMHRVRSGLLLLGYVTLADECKDIELDCRWPHIEDGTLKRRGWRIARQMRAISMQAGGAPIDAAFSS